MDRVQYQRFADIDAHHWWFQARRRIVSSLLNSMWPRKVESRNILDIGTGTGGMVPVLSLWGHVTATEPDPETMEFTQKSFESFGQSVSFKASGWEDLDLPSNHFDLITAFDVLEHCADDEQALHKWRCWLKNEGVLLLTVPAFPSLWGLNDEISHHYRRYTRNSLLEVLHSSGFVVEKISYINSLMFVPVWISRNIKDRIQRRFSKETTPMPWDFDLPPAPLNVILERLFSAERIWLKYGELPWGTSLLAVARVSSTMSECPPVVF